MSGFQTSKATALCASLLLTFAAMTPPSALALGDISAGEDTFYSECADCHSVKPGRNKKGPSLDAIVGRKSGSVSDYHYSDAMKAADITWSAEKIAEYVTEPKKIVPGTKMKYEGLDDAKARDDLLAYLNSLSH